MLNIANVTGQFTIMGVIYYLAFSNSVYAGAALVVGHALFEGSTYLFQREVLRQVAAAQEEYQKQLVDEPFGQTKGNC